MVSPGVCAWAWPIQSRCSGTLAPTVNIAARPVPTSSLRITFFMKTLPLLIVFERYWRRSAVVRTLAAIFVEGIDLRIGHSLGALAGALADQHTVIFDDELSLAQGA